MGERLLDFHQFVAVDAGELCEDGVFEPLFGQAVAVAFAGSVLVAGGAGVVGVAATVSVLADADVGAAAMVATKEPGEEEVGWVAAS